MHQLTRATRYAVAALTTLGVATTGQALGQPANLAEAQARNNVPTKHQYTVDTQQLRGDTYVCGDLTLRVTRGRLTETTDADLRDGIARISISRIAHGVRLHGSDGRTYRASGVTAAWFVLHAPDLGTPVHGLEINQLMFRGGPEKSPGWLRERIAWVDKHETDQVRGPCTFGDE